MKIAHHIIVLNSLIILIILIIGLFASSFALADTHIETFDAGANPSAWMWGFGDSIPSTGGNPGSYLRTDGLDTFAPQPRPTAGTFFTGNYRTRHVSCIGVDLITYAVDFGA